jgi:hypothetical protein
VTSSPASPSLSCRPLWTSIWTVSTHKQILASSVSFRARLPLRLHFGLANYPVLEKAEIFWPDGKKEVLTNLASDRFYVVLRAGM